MRKPVFAYYKIIALHHELPPELTVLEEPAANESSPQNQKDHTLAPQQTLSASESPVQNQTDPMLDPQQGIPASERPQNQTEPGLTQQQGQPPVLTVIEGVPENDAQVVQVANILASGGPAVIVEPGSPPVILVPAGATDDETRSKCEAALACLGGGTGTFSLTLGVEAAMTAGSGVVGAGVTAGGAVVLVLGSAIGLIALILKVCCTCGRKAEMKAAMDDAANPQPVLGYTVRALGVRLLKMGILENPYLRAKFRFNVGSLWGTFVTAVVTIEDSIASGILGAISAVKSKSRGASERIKDAIEDNSLWILRRILLSKEDAAVKSNEKLTREVKVDPGPSDPAAAAQAAGAAYLAGQARSAAAHLRSTGDVEQARRDYSEIRSLERKYVGGTSCSVM